MAEQQNPVLRFFKGIWRAIDITGRTFFGLIAVFFVIVFLISIFSGGDGPKVIKGSALVFAPQGVIVEQKTFVDPVAEALGELNGQPPVQEELVYDLIEVLRNAKDDDRISALVISPSAILGAGATKLADLSVALKDFKTSGKPVYAMADFYSQTGYYLAAHADEIVMNPDGALVFDGLDRTRTYYKEALDKLGVTVNIFRVGTFKSAVEPYLRSGMSDAAKEANIEWMGDVWAHLKQGMAETRGIEVSELDAYINGFSAAVSAANGDMAKVGLDSGLIDSLMNRTQFRDMMIEKVGMDEQKRSFNQINHSEYLRSIRPFGDMPLPTNKPKVAVIVAKGEILDGRQREGAIGGDTLASIIRKARLDDTVKAIVLRVDSPGGSAFASEVIRDELLRAQADGKPVVASMASVAASGGYWISATADEIWAYPTTITGSIGIFGMIPTIEKPLNELGIYRDGVGTAPLAGALDFGKPLSEEVGTIIQSSIEHGYDEFLSLVAEGRDMTTAQVDQIAQGRVWSGEDALRLGLVDNLGGLNDAVASAAKLANLEDYKMQFYKRDLSEQEQLIKQLFGSAEAHGLIEERAAAAKPNQFANKLIETLSEDLTTLMRFNDPNHAYVYCGECELD